jgi:CO/xanthine dehydrogenase Mo-binding subunit
LPRRATSSISSAASLRVESQYQQPTGIEWDDKTYKGDAYATYAWAVYVAEVTVDLTTYETRVDRFWALQDAGTIIHPVMAAGQIEGGVAQGIGLALYEKVVWKEGRMQNAQMTNYIMPTSLDVPDILSSSTTGPRAWARRRHTVRVAPKASASCRWMARPRRWRRRYSMRPVCCVVPFP